MSISLREEGKTPTPSKNRAEQRLLIRRKRRKRKKILIQTILKKKKIAVLRTTPIKVEKPRITTKEGLAILVGTQIGAGVLGLPYAAAQVGLILASVILIGVMLLLLFTALIVLKFTVEMNGAQLSTIAYRVLGHAGGWTMYISIFIMSFGALLAYTAGMGNVLANLFGLNADMGAILFWGFASAIIYMGLEASGKTELIMSYVMLVLFLGVTVMLVPHTKIENSLYMDYGGILTITGVAIFSLGSHTVIPDVYRGIGNYRKTKNVVILAFLIPTAIYAVFMAAFLLVFGNNTPQIATQGLAKIYGLFGDIVGNVIPILAITTSFIGIGLAHQSNTREFFKIRKPVAWAITALPPLIVYLAGIKNFADVLAFSGDTGDMMSFIIIPIAIWIVKMWRKRNTVLH